MGGIADSLINGEFDFITGEYIGEAVGFPRTRSYGKRNAPPIIKKPSSKANVGITNMCKDRGFDSRKKQNWCLSSCRIRDMNSYLNCHVSTR